MNQKAFTLVELLAVIVIMGIVLAIATVAISGIISNAKKDTFKADAVDMLRSVTAEIVKDSTIDPTTITTANIGTYARTNEANYQSLRISYNSKSELYLFAVGAGKYEGATAYGTINNMTSENSVVQNGLILYLDADILYSYPGSGTTWYDLSGNNNNGIINNGEFYSNYFRNLNDTSNFFSVTIPHSTSLNTAFTQTTGGWTIEEVLWTNSTVYPEADAGSVASNQGFGAGSIGFDWNHGSGITSFRFEQANGTSWDDGTITIPAQYQTFNKWRFRTMVWNRSENKNYLYINGSLIGTYSTASTANSAIYDGGGISLGTLYGWKHYGRRDSLKIYNRVLSAAEVQQNYNAQKDRFGL